MKKYSKEFLILKLKEFFEKNKISPLASDFGKDKGLPSWGTYRIHFGSWNNALKEANIPLNIVHYYTDEYLLNELKRYYNDTGKIPSINGLRNTNNKYPFSDTYINHFDSWKNAIKMVGFSSIKNEVEKGRCGEVVVFNSFKNKEMAMDISGKNSQSYFDGICPNGKIYDVKSSSLNCYKSTLKNKLYIYDGWGFKFNNKEKEKIEYYFLLGYDKNHEKLINSWMVPSYIIFPRISVTIKNSEKSINKWKEYKISLNKGD